MALLARFFSPRRNQKKDSNVHQTLQNKISLRSSFRIEHDQVRILLFRECDWRGRKLLFDSSCVQKVPVNNLQVNGGGQSRRNSKDLIFEISNGFGYQYTRPSRDATSLGETIFGSVALSQKRSSIKVHSLHGPRRLMLSSVIYSPRPYRRRQISDRSLDDSFGSSINSMSDYFSGSSSDAKSSFGDCQDGSLDQSLGNCDTAAYCPIHCSSLTPNCNSGTSNCSNQSGGSLTSLRRRWLRSVTTSMNLDSLHNLVDIDSSQTTESNSSAESTQNSQTSTPKQRTKLGVAILINLHESQEKEMEEYLLQRIPLLVHLVARLQQNSERAYAHKDSFVQLMMDATADTAQALYDMLCGVCVEIPFWITLTSKQYEDNMTVQNELLSKCVKDLGYLLQTVDTKHTNFFMSTLLTAVLTHHLGWVPTVVPDKDSKEKQNQQDMLSALSQSHPYSPLWAQLSDLQGALGFPPKITKTVIVGQSDILVSKILSVLTYFIRCGLVYSTPEERLENSGEDCLLEAIVSSKSDSPIESSKIEEKFENTHDRDSELVKLPNSVLSKRRNLSNSNLLNELENNKNFSKKIHSDNNLMKNNCSNVNLGNNEDNFKSSGFKKTSSSAALNKMVNYIEEEMINENNFHPDVISDKVSKLCRVPKSAILYHMKIDENNIKEESDKDAPIAIKNSHTFTNFHSKIESEKQMASVDIKNHINRTLFQKDGKISLVNQGDLNLSQKENEKNVIFVLGENEELIGLKSNSNTQNNCKNVITPTICIDRCDEDATYNDDNQSFIISNNNNSGERSLKTLSKDDSIKTDDNRKNNKVLIIKPTTIEVEDCKNLSPIFNMPPQRCLSIPDEAMLVTDEIKEKRSRETVEIVRRWLSDSEIYTNKHKHCGVDFPDVKNTSNELINGNSSEFDIGVVKNDRTNVEYCVELNLPSVSNDCDSVKRTSKDVNVNNCDNFEQDNDCFNRVNKNESSVIPSSDIHLPLPNSKMEDSETEIDLARTLIGGVSDHYIPSLVLQGIIQNSNVSRPPWESELRRDLQIEAHSPVLNQEISESVCIVANIDTWEVQLVSSHTLVVEKILEGRSMGVRVGMSQLVANMLETVLTLCKLSVQPKHCISHIEAKLGEFWLKSITLSEMLLSKEFLDMDTLTSALDLDPNDVPLLLSVASIHSPQVTKKYGLSFQ